MRKLLLVSAALAFSAAGAANAADLPVKATPMAPAYAAPSYSWTGCGISGGVGYGMWNQDAQPVTDPGGAVITNTSTTNGGRGWLGRVGVGCDYQISPSFVI